MFLEIGTVGDSEQDLHRHLREPMRSGSVEASVRTLQTGSTSTEPTGESHRGAPSRQRVMTTDDLPIFQNTGNTCYRSLLAMVQEWQQTADGLQFLIHPPRILFLQVMRFSLQHGRVRKNNVRLKIPDSILIPTLVDGRKYCNPIVSYPAYTILAAVHNQVTTEPSFMISETRTSVTVTDTLLKMG